MISSRSMTGTVIRVGDRVLQEVSSVFRRELRSIDLLARYGGEEIVMLLPETDCSGVMTVR
jgi:diguanylate cyclase (GGDEF)-like protein